MSVGGSIESVSLDGRSFAVAGDTEVQRKLGGFENEMQSNGNGTSRQIKTRVPWSLAGVAVDVDDARSDHEFLQELSDRNDEWPVAITYASGTVYQGSGQIIGELQYSNQNTMAGFDLAGSQKLTAQ